MSLRAAPILICAVACGAPPANHPLYTAGSDKDEGHGVLAMASARLMTADPNQIDPLSPEPVPRRYAGAAGPAAGGNAYGGSFYGGTTYATYVAPQWGYPSANRTPAFVEKAGLTSAIEGTITWRGGTPKLTTACGAIEPLQIGDAHALAGVLVYIERVGVGRVLPHGAGERRPATVGGVVVKRGCSFLPSVQVVTPIPAGLAIHGDRTRTRIRITTPETTRSTDLHEGGRVAMQANAGVIRVESEDGALGAAWVVGVETPSYAITDDRGRFRIAELAPGTYDLTIWQPPVPTLAAGALVYGAPVIVHRSVKVGGGVARLDVTLGH